MIASVLEYHIVISADIEHVKVWIVYFPVSVPGTKSLGYGACGVVIQNGLLQHLCGVYHADVFTLYHLIADAPTDDAGVIAVALYHRTDILPIA